ncbi:UvrD-helicase domain-containing protein [Photobacterium kishitanii]|uniref:UvrD-helicase domain-containing protein n=1 Tax=Photobacterium kishitanii TaxID=318456 RepID=UPI000AEF0C23|nr:UvrD-helicase domain-containing protein [Photobacterium kishitanii]
MIEFTGEQEAYIQSDINTHVFLEACPGSGKTEVVAAKVAREASTWDRFPGGIAVLSFANSATDELKNRVFKYLPGGRSLFPHFLGTFDSFIYKNIVNPLACELTGYEGVGGDCSIRIVEGTSNLGFRTTWKVASRGYVYAHHYSLDKKKKKLIFNTGDRVHDRLLNSVVFENWQIKDLISLKKKMLSAGYATYKDIEYLAFKALSIFNFNNYFQIFSRRYPLIIVDECQDLSFEQLIILQKLSDFGVKLHFIGDLHQAIYGFRDVDPSAVGKFAIDNDFIQLALTKNFRSCQQIINVCGELTGRNNIEGKFNQSEPACYVIQYENCPTELVDIFHNICYEYKNTVIVARGYSTLQKFQTQVVNLNIIQKLALAIQLFNSDDMEAIEKSITLYSEFLRYYLKESVKPSSFNCPQSISSNLIWRQFLFSSILYLSNDTLKDMDVTWSAWVSRVKPLLRSLNEQSFVNEHIIKVVEPLTNINIMAPRGLAKELVSEYLGHPMNLNISYRKTTIHGSKGETHDATILISSPDARGSSNSHWTHWIRDSNSEGARFAYVASSRPKYRLIWAVKKLNLACKKRFEDMGFHVI